MSGTYKKTIYLIRHGQTDYNKRKIVQGSGVDASLNELGRRQAGLFYGFYKNHPFDKVYTSKLKRSIQSVQGFIDAGIPHEPLSGLNEINWGEKEGKPFSEADHSVYLKTTKAWESGQLDLAIPGGETPLEVMARQEKALNYIMQQEDEQEILICMHGRAMRIFLCLMMRCDLSRMDQFSHENLCLYKLVYDKGEFVLESRNDVSHLKELTV